MIPVEELYIGCHVEDGLQRRCRVREITQMTVGVNTPNGDWIEIVNDKVYPIEITPELLTELGFEYRDNTYWERWFLGGFDIERKEDSKYFDYSSEIRLEYLHELEVLYYMIYGKELIND